MALLLPVTQQLTGINILVIYVSSIFSTYQVLYEYMGTLLNVLQMCGGLYTASLLARHGRKHVLLWGLAILTVCNLMLGLVFISEENVEKDVWRTGWKVLGCIVFFWVFGVSAGPIVWQYVPEIVEGNIVGLATLTNWTSVFVIVLIYPLMEARVGAGKIFITLAGLLLLACALLWVLMVETKDKPESQIFEEYEMALFYRNKPL